MAKMKPTATPDTQELARTPRLAGEEGSPPARPSAAQHKPFVLIWPIGGYVMLGDGRGGYFLAPRLIEQRLENGESGAIQNRDGAWDISGLIDDSRQSRKRVLPMGLGYCLEFAPDCYRPAWSTLTPDGRVVVSPVAYADWLKQLMADETIPPPGPEAVAGLVRQHEILLEQAQAKFQPGSRAIKDAEKLHEAAQTAAQDLEAGHAQ